MRPDDSDPQPAPPKHPHRHAHGGWPPPTKATAPLPPRSGKTMHHPATRIGEIKHGKT